MASHKGEEANSSIPYEGQFLKSFMRMQTIVEDIYQYQKKGEQGGPSHVEGKKGGGEEPPKIPASFPSYLDGSLHSPFENKKGTIDFNVPQLNVDIKFELPMYNGELNAEKLDNWIRQIEVYCRIQKFTKDSIKIQLASLRLARTVVIWWESRSQEDLATKGKTISSWYEFTSYLKK